MKIRSLLLAGLLATSGFSFGGANDVADLVALRADFAGKYQAFKKSTHFEMTKGQIRLAGLAIFSFVTYLALHMWYGPTIKKTPKKKKIKSSKTTTHPEESSGDTQPSAAP